LVVSFTVIALTLVHLRAEQTRCAAGSLRAEAESIRLRREQWELQARIARLRTPQRVHDFVDSMQMDLLPPGEETASGSAVLLTSGRQ
jgi:hypothetical protein